MGTSSSRHRRRPYPPRMRPTRRCCLRRVSGRPECSPTDSTDAGQPEPRQRAANVIRNGPSYRCRRSWPALARYRLSPRRPPGRSRLCRSMPCADASGPSALGGFARSRRIWTCGHQNAVVGCCWAHRMTAASERNVPRDAQTENGMAGNLSRPSAGFRQAPRVARRSTGAAELAHAQTPGAVRTAVRCCAEHTDRSAQGAARLRWRVREAEARTRLARQDQPPRGSKRAGRRLGRRPISECCGWAGSSG